MTSALQRELQAKTLHRAGTNAGKKTSFDWSTISANVVSCAQNIIKNSQSIIEDSYNITYNSFSLFSKTGTQQTASPSVQKAAPPEPPKAPKTKAELKKEEETRLKKEAKQTLKQKTEEWQHYVSQFNNSPTRINDLINIYSNAKNIKYSEIKKMFLELFVSEKSIYRFQIFKDSMQKYMLESYKKENNLAILDINNELTKIYELESKESKEIKKLKKLKNLELTEKVSSFENWIEPKKHTDIDYFIKKEEEALKHIHTAKRNLYKRKQELQQRITISPETMQDPLLYQLFTESYAELLVLKYLNKHPPLNTKETIAGISISALLIAYKHLTYNPQPLKNLLGLDLLSNKLPNQELWRCLGDEILPLEQMNLMEETFFDNEASQCIDLNAMFKEHNKLSKKIKLPEEIEQTTFKEEDPIVEPLAQTTDISQIAETSVQQIVEMPMQFASPPTQWDLQYTDTVYVSYTVERTYYKVPVSTDPNAIMMQPTIFDKVQQTFTASEVQYLPLTQSLVNPEALQAFAASCETPQFSPSTQSLVNPDALRAFAASCETPQFLDFQADDMEIIDPLENQRFTLF
ncbi:MAG: hypothetical protein S4CHLAM123_08820 [Chlamydiales bacterium]|nr:hypothetical protein [Chlamydiales bacterium]